MTKICSLAFALTLALAGTAFGQSPAPSAPPQFQTRGGPTNEQQLREWQQQRADEYYRRLREYQAAVGRMA